jgi:hypothetical protein
MLANARDVECDAIQVVPKTIPIYGSIYDMRTGRLNEVKLANVASKAVA